MTEKRKTEQPEWYFWLFLPIALIAFITGYAVDIWKCYYRCGQRVGIDARVQEILNEKKKI
jgi:hypothetical protein